MKYFWSSYVDDQYRQLGLQKRVGGRTDYIYQQVYNISVYISDVAERIAAVEKRWRSKEQRILMVALTESSRFSHTEVQTTLHRPHNALHATVLAVNVAYFTKLELTSNDILLKW